jgi:hypothetical protein
MNGTQDCACKTHGKIGLVCTTIGHNPSGLGLENGVEMMSAGTLVAGKQGTSANTL